MCTPTEKELRHAVRTCHWRQSIGGVDICAGSCNVCATLIERGQCDTLKELFRDTAKELYRDIAKTETSNQGR